jgi:hypothetical protein
MRPVMSKVEQVARALQAAKIDGQRIRFSDEYAILMARAAIEAMPLEQLIRDAYVRGVEWNEENPLDREYRFKASADYADKVLSAALQEQEPQP